MLTPVTLSVPAGVRYRTLAVEMAGKYASLCGSAAPGATAFGAAIASALEELAAGTRPEATLTVEFRANDGHVEAVLAGNGRSSTVQCALPVER
jgi:hypothetical protein